MSDAPSALERHQPKKHNHRNAELEPLADEVIGQAIGRIGDDRIESMQLTRVEEIDSAYDVVIRALVPTRSCAMTTQPAALSSRAIAPRPAAGSKILGNWSRIPVSDQSARGARRRLVEIVAAVFERPRSAPCLIIRVPSAASSRVVIVARSPFQG